MAKPQDIPANAVENIMSVYAQATPAEIADGIAWYKRAQSGARKLSREHNVTLRVAITVTAALSPNNRWERNVKDADSLIGAYLGGEHMLSVKVCTYHAMRAKAWDVMSIKPRTHEEARALLKGQKIVSFYECISGLNTCCVDGHARNIAYGERLSLSGSKFTIGKAEYRRLQELYAEAGERVGLKAYEMQAITWVVWRRIHNV